MDRINRNSISLSREAKAGLSSLFKQTAGVGAGLVVMLVLTGGNPPGFLVALSFIVGVGFVAWSEKKRLTESRKQVSSSPDTKNSQNTTPSRYRIVSLNYNSQSRNIRHQARKASEVLKRYAAGERNFQRLNLQGQSFKNQNLSGADFSEADIRGTDFSSANLKDAIFERAEAGLPVHRAFILIIFLFPAILEVGIGFGLAGLFLVTVLNLAYVQEYLIGSYGVGAILILSLSYVVSQRYAVARETWGTTENYQKLDSIVGLSVRAALGSVLLLVVAIFLTLSAKYELVIIVTAVAGTSALLSFLLALAIAGANTIAGPLTVAVILLGLVVIAGTIARILVSNNIVSLTGAITLVVGASALISLLAIYIGSEAFKGNQKFAWISLISRNFASIGGTSFRKANLTSAVFTRATLKATDFREATLTHTNFLNARELERSRYENPNYSIISNPVTRNLLVTGNGYNKNFAGVNLSGANLVGANLENANLRQANLSNTLLHGANLKNANLTQALAVGTDFSSAYLTGACLEAWNIDANTNLDNVDCQYVFLLEHPNAIGHRKRCPHDPDAVFQSGEFEKIHSTIINVVQIFLRNGTNSEAFKIAWLEAMKEYPEATGANKDNVKIAGVLNEADRKKTYQTAAEIQQLLQQLEQSYPTTTAAEQMTFAAKAIEIIENNPTLKQKAISALRTSALRTGEIKEFEEAIGHPAAKIIIAVLQGWQEDP